MVPMTDQNGLDAAAGDKLRALTTDEFARIASNVAEYVR